MKNTHKKIVSTIISKTLIFVFVVLLIGVFKSIFGAENSLVGVTSVVLMLALLQQDLTRSPLKYLSKLILFNVVLGGATFVANQNVWLALVINFSIMCFIGYTFSYELRTSLNMLFGLHYILMLTNPVSIEQLPMRLLSLVFAAFMIMAAQFLVNKNKLTKSSDRILNNIQDNILVKIDLLKEENEIVDINEIIEKEINKLKMMIYDSGKKESNITEYGKNRINILSCLEKVNILLDKINEKNIDKIFLNDIKTQLLNAKHGKFNINSLENLISKYEEMDINTMHEFIFAIEHLSIQKEEGKKLTNIAANIRDNINEIPLEFRSISNLRKNINIKSNRVAYGIRLGLLVAITSFITNFFNLEFGNWMVYTVFSLTQLYSDYTKLKSKKRIVGTIIGALIVFILFNIIKDSSTRSIILVATGYFMSYVSDYKHVAIFVTISSICSAVINIPDPNIVIINRVVFVGIGAIISLIANKFVLERKYKDEEMKLNTMQKDISNRIIEEVLLTEDINGCSVENLVLIPAFIDDRVQNLNLNIGESLAYNCKQLINQIHQIYLIGSKNHSDLICNAKDIIVNSRSKEVAKTRLVEYMETIDSHREKALLGMVLNTIKEMHYTNNNADILDLEIAL